MSSDTQSQGSTPLRSTPMGSRSDMREEGEMQTSPGGVETKVRPKKLGHVVLRVRNVERSERFYAEVLGLHVTQRIPGRMVFMSASLDASHELALMSIGADAPGPEEGRDVAVLVWDHDRKGPVSTTRARGVG